MQYNPRPYQRFCCQQILDKPALALWLRMGRGKTIITLSAIHELRYNRFAVYKVLIIAPKKVAEATWQDEALKWDHTRQLKFSTVLGSQAQRIRALNTPADIYIINRDNVTWLVDLYRNDWPFDMVVVDEASSFKSNKAQRWKALKSIRGHVRRIVELTGTPASHSLLDLWPQVFLLDGGQRLGKSIGQFRERYFDPDKRCATQIFTYKPKQGAERSIKSLLSDICISLGANDGLTLPPEIPDPFPVVLTPTAARVYRKLEKEALLQVDEHLIDAGSAGVLTNKLLQLCNGAVYDDHHRVVEVHRCKLEAFAELIEALNGQHALVFYNFQHDRDRMLKLLSRTQLRVRVFHGAQDEHDWNAGRIDVLLVHPMSCAYGLNLQQGGHHVIWFGLPWSLELYQQANERLHRPGQKEPVVIHQLIVKGGVDEDVIASLRDKAHAQDTLLQLLKVRIRRAKGE